MIREKLILDNNIFIADYYINGVDKNCDYYSNFVFIRNYTIINEVVQDKDIFFIEKSLYKEVIEEMYKNQSKSTDLIVYPTIKNGNISYSNNYELFNGLFFKNSMYNVDKSGNLSLGFDVYKLYNNKCIEKTVKCNLIRLYKPNSLKNINGIIHVSNFINGVNFHYLCKKYNQFESKLDNEFKVDNEIYCEYIELLIPSIEDLFNETTFYKDDLNNIEVCTTDANKSFVENKTISNNGEVYTDFSVFLYPYSIIYNDKIDEDLEIGKKLYIKPINNNKLINIYSIHPLKLSLYTYNSINDTNNIYILDNKLLSAISTFVIDNSVELCNKICFDENNSGKISISSNIVYKNINMSLIDENDRLTSFNTYCRYNNINKYEYIDYKNNILNIIKADFCEEYGYDINALNNINSKEYKMFNTFIEESEENLNSKINFIGFNLIVSTDINGNNVIYDQYIPLNITDELLENNNIDISKKISIYKIFDNWIELPQTLYATIIFIDRYIGAVIKGNKVPIIKEWYKYIISDSEILQIRLQSNDMKELTLDSNSGNSPLFINNINCVIKKESDNNTQITKNNNTKILYKPYFYKVQDLQYIYLRSGLIQNIGINLTDYMTKVNTFKLSIENLIYTEIGRNDAYVIFRVNAAEIVNSLGRYDIFNEEDTYISSGEYNIY